MKFNLQSITAVLGLILMVPGIALVFGAAQEVRQEIATNTNWRVLQTWQRLDAIRQQRQLTQVEWVEWCKVGRQLGVFTVCPPR